MGEDVLCSRWIYLDGESQSGGLPTLQRLGERAMTIERPPWRYRTKEARKDRDIGIMEKYDLGWSRHKIAEHYDLTPARVGQIVSSFGETFRE